ncbi:hemolysin family protein [Chthonobacter albigriseus]|uniref:hemolysin family protein n=1 Tax=Chthonobacter albigriseus TaxID=1683161 RepID=UPI001FCEC3A1|nr:hemolysin family protein [Chthonobacter albigriseus]
MSDSDTQSSSAASFVAPGMPPAGTGVDTNGTPLPIVSWLDRLREAFGFRPASLRQNLETALSQEDALDAAFSPEERAMIRNILRLRETRVDDVMVPRADIEAVSEEIPLSDLLLTFEQSGHSRMPVYRKTLDDAVGMVHIKDLMAYVTTRGRRQTGEGEDISLDLGLVDLSLPLVQAELVRPVLFVPPSMPATDLLAKMQAARIQMALVIDEYGGTDGIVSIEDVVETIVGEIDDEHDEEDAPMVTETGEGVYLADARADLDDVVAVIGPEFKVDDYDDEVDTLGGLLFALLGRIPARGEVVTADELPGFEIEVVEADPRRLQKVRILKLADGEVSGRSHVLDAVPPHPG